MTTERFSGGQFPRHPQLRGFFQEQPAGFSQARWRRHRHFHGDQRRAVRPGGGAAAARRPARLADGFQRLPAHRRGWARDVFHRQNRDGPGNHHVVAADAGRGIGHAARHGGHRDGRHRPVSVGHGHFRLDVHAHVRSGAARGGGGSQSAFCWNWPPTRSKFRKRNSSPKTASFPTRRTRKIKSATASLRRDRRLNGMLQTKPSLKDPAQFKIAGQSHTRQDGEAKVTGKAHYAADIRVPGMLYAKILRPPAHGATLKSVDTAAAKAVTGVQVIQDGDLVAVLHEFPDVAEAAQARAQTRRIDVPARRGAQTLRFPQPAAALWRNALS